MLRLAATFLLALAPCGPAPATPPAASDDGTAPHTTATAPTVEGEPYVPDRVCAVTLPSGGSALVVQGCECVERLDCTAHVSGHAIAITARTHGVVACDECPMVEGTCELGRLPTDAVIEIEVDGKKIGELHTDAAGTFAAGPCFDASQPGPR